MFSAKYRITRFRIYLVLLAMAFAMTFVGCGAKANPTTPVALAPGYNNQADQQMGEILAGANAFYNKIQADSSAGVVTLGATEKTALNALGQSINVANVAYLAYHNGTGSQAAAQTAINDVQTKQAAVQVPGVTK